MVTRHTRLFAITLGALALALAGCSDDEGSGSTDAGVDAPSTDMGGGDTAATDPGGPTPDSSQPDPGVTDLGSLPQTPCTVFLSEANWDESGAGAHEFLELGFAGDFAGRNVTDCGVASVALYRSNTDTCEPQGWAGVALPAVAIPASGRWVIGTEAVAGAHQVVTTDDLIEADTAGLIALLDASGPSRAAYVYGNCKPSGACASVVSGVNACLPADLIGAEGGDPSGVSACDGAAGYLTARPLTPDAANACDCPTQCNDLAGQCELGTCEAGVCQFTPLPDGNACDDNSLCTTGDACASGACAGTPKACTPTDACQAAGVCDPSSGDCTFVSACDPNAECVGGACACLAGFDGDGASCADIDECALGTAGCDALATCKNEPGSASCFCPPGTYGDGTTCTQATCDCAWEEAEGQCGPQSAMLEVIALDIWAQELVEPLIWVNTPEGLDVTFDFTTTVTTPLCLADTLFVYADNPRHHYFDADVFYDGTGGAAGLSVELYATDQDVAYYVTTDLRDEGGQQVRYYTIWVGLAHSWFAPTGRPARHGNDVTLLMDGEEAWASVRTELLQAQSLVTASSWWWNSEFELLRDPATHAGLNATQRWGNTVMGILEGLPGVDRKVLVGQFYSQDGLLSGFTVDDELEAKGAAAGDNFEFMGMANEVAGQFTVTPPSVDFAARVSGEWSGAASATYVEQLDLPAFMGPIAVDAAELPLGLSIFDVPLASWHQKFLTVDQEVAFIGGMNIKTTDWDTNEHLVFNSLRMNFDADAGDRQEVADKEAEPDFGPRKDYMVRIEGPSAVDAVDVFQKRWAHQLSAGVEYSENASGFAVAAPAAAMSGGVQAQVVATMPAPFDETHILDTLLRAVKQAEHYIYIEDQYFRAPLLYDAVIERMYERPELVLIVVTKPIAEWTDPGCWQTYLADEQFKALFPGRYRAYQLRVFDYVRTDCFFCIDETDAHFGNMDTHSKMVVIDDVYVETGSCNSNNRGLLYEGELATVVVDDAFATAARHRVFGNILGASYSPSVTPAQFISVFDAAASGNQQVWDNWDDEGMDLDLDGDPMPGQYIPEGFLYPLPFDSPDDCFIEGVGADVT